MANPNPQPSVILDQIPEGFQTDWEIFVTGDNVRVVDGRLLGATGVVMEMRKKGIYRSLQYGLMGSEGNAYDAIGYYENGGGGTVAFPWAEWHGKIYVGVVRQHRQLMGKEPVLVAAGGYQNIGKSAEETGRAEGAEEVGNRHLFMEQVMMRGVPVNPNRSVWITAGEGEGVKFMSIQVDSEAFEEGDDGILRFKEEVVRASDGGQEKVMGTLFIPAKMALHEVPDNLVTAATGRLMSELGRIRW